MKADESKHEENQLVYVISYLTMRRAIGILGIALPFVMIIGSAIGGGQKVILSSISSYYHTNMGDVFVGILCAVALFMFSYRGYDYKDNIAGNLAGIFALGIALLPTSPISACPFIEYNPLIGKIHFASAALFFIVVSYISIRLFTKTYEDREPTDQKVSRNKIYRACGYVILISIVLIAIYAGLIRGAYKWLDRCHPIFWLEAISLLSFGISWLVKGEVIMRDVNSSN